SLVEEVKESCAELKLLRFAEVEILEERNVEVAPAGSPHIERRLRRPALGKRRDFQRPDVEDLLTEPGPTRLRVAHVDRRDGADAGAGARAVEGVRAVPRQ